MNQERIFLDNYEILTGEKQTSLDAIPHGLLAYMRDVGASALLRPLVRWRREHGQSYGRISLAYNVSRPYAHKLDKELLTDG